MKKNNLILFLILLGVFFSLVSLAASYSASNPKYYYGGTYSSFGSPSLEWDTSMCEQSQDFLLQIDATGCSPVPVRSDLLEEQDVPVFCPIRATKINPFIDVSQIDSITFGGNYPREVRTIGFIPNKAALSSQFLGFYGSSDKVENPTYENIGYAVVMLRQNQNESSMPDFVKGTINATIRYDIQNSFGIGENTFFIPEMSYSEWDKIKNQYSFWDGRGYLAVEGVDSNSATIVVYSDVYRGSFEGRTDEKRKYGSFRLAEGASSSVVYLPGLYCFAGLQIKLDELVNPDTRAVLKVDSEYYTLQEGDKFLDNRCHIVKNSIGKDGINQRVEVYCKEDDSTFWESDAMKTLFISPQVNLTIDDQQENYHVGDYLGYSEDEGKHMYLGYAKFSGSSNNPKDLQAYIYLTPEKVGEVISESQYDYLEKMANYKDRATDKGLTLVESFEEDFGTLKGDILDIEEGIRTGDDVIKIVVGESSSLNEIKDHIIILNGLGIGDTLDLNINTSEYYGESKQSYERVIEDYPDETYESQELSLESFKEKIDLAKFLGQSFEVLEICSEFKELYPELVDSVGCEKDVSFYSSSNSKYDVLIDGELHSISLVKIDEPSFEDYGVSVLVKFSDGTTTSFNLDKDERRTINISSGEYIELTGLDIDSATLKVYVANDSFYNRFVSIERNFNLNDPKTLGDNVVIKVTKINLKKQAKISIIPEQKYQRSYSDFNFNIGIEKRAIQLAPEKVESLVEKLNKQVEDWKKFSDNLGVVVKDMKAACLGVGAALTVKNFIQNADGKSIARQMVMRSSGGWTEHCAGEVSAGNYASQENCYFQNADTINKEVNSVYQTIKSQNENIKNIQDKHLIPNQLKIFGDNVVDTESFVGEYAQSVISNVNIGSIQNPDDSSQYVLTSDMSTIFSGEDSFNKGYYNLEDLKNFDLYYRLYQQTGDEKYLKKLYDLSSRLKENSDSFLQINDALQGTGISASDFSYVTTEEGRIQEYYKGNTLDKWSSVIDNEYNLPLSTPVQGIQTSDGFFLFILDDSIKTGVYPIKQHIENDGTSSYLIYDFTGTRVTDKTRLDKLLKIDFRVLDSTSYNNKFNPSPGEKDVIVRYYEEEPYQGLPAVVPFDKDNGWYAYVQQKVAVLGGINSYDVSGRINSFWLCNVGPNGYEEFNSNQKDDVCELVNLGTGQPYNQFPGLTESESSRLVNKAVSAIEAASRQYKSGVKRITLPDGGIVGVGSPATNVPSVECTDFMSPSDCKVLFNVCDPVICPSSRCDFGGAYPVKDVIQTGIVGSVALCLPNAKEGIYVPVCLSGVKAGLDGWVSVMDSYRDCLQTNLETGETVGICDEIHSVYMCEFFWRQALPLANLAVPKILSTVLGQNSHGGGEYLGVQSAWQNAQDSVSYFTQYYAADSYKAFKARSSEEVGTAACKTFISATYPGGVSILDSLTEPDSPPQFTGKFEEIPYSTVTNPPSSHYKVFYHIYAGNDRGAYYKVYLRESSQSSYYQDGVLFGNVRNVDSGYIPKGDYETQTVDFTAPSGFKELCIRVNDQEECGFQEVSTSFAIDYVQDQYVKQQATQTDIKTQKACISGTASFYNLLNPNLEETASDLIDPKIYNQGIQRICASNNPGSGSNPERWVDVGYCGDTEIRCWLDKSSVGDAVVFNYTEGQTLSELEKYFQDNLENNPNNTDYFGEGQFKEAVETLKLESNPIKRINFIDSIVGKMFFNSQKAYLYYLRGNAYRDLTKGSFNEYQKVLAQQKAEREAAAAKEKEEKKKEILGNSNPRERVLAAVEYFNGRIVDKAEIGDCDNSGVITCHDSVLAIYQYANVDKNCVYSDGKGKSYSLSGNIIKISETENAYGAIIFQANDQPMKSCTLNKQKSTLDLSASEKLGALKEGDILSIALDYKTPHNIIFLKWIDEENYVAEVFDWNQHDEKGNRIFGKFTLNLGDNSHPVYMYWEPIGDGVDINGEEQVAQETEDLNEALDNVVDPSTSSKIQMRNMCFKFFNNEWHWSMNCDVVGTTLDLDVSGSGLVNEYITVEWVDTKTFEDSYGRKTPRDKYSKIILELQDKNYDEGLSLLINKAVELGNNLDSQSTRMDDKKVFEVGGFSNYKKVSFEFVEDEWVFKRSGDKYYSSLRNEDTLDNNPKFTAREKAAIKKIKDDNFDFVKGAKYLFSLNLEGLPNVYEGENYFKDLTIETAIEQIRPLSGKYTDEDRPQNKEIIDEICRSSVVSSSEYILTEAQCIDVKGGSNFFEKLANGANNFDDVKEMLIVRYNEVNAGKWGVPSAILKAELIGEGNYFDLERAKSGDLNFGLEKLRTDGLLEVSKYNELKSKGRNGEDIVPELISYLEEGHEYQPLVTVWNYDSAIKRAGQLQGTYSDSAVNTDFIDEICNQDLLTEDQCSDVKGEGAFFGWFNRENDIPTDVKQMLEENKANGIGGNSGSKVDQLCDASIEGNLNLVKSLVMQGVSVDSECSGDGGGLKPLHLASLYDNWEIVEYLLEKGANIETTNKNGFTPLLWAVDQNSLNTVKILVENGADIEAKREDDYKGRNSLITAVYLDYFEIVKYLVESGANVNAVDNEGKTALDYAIEEENQEVIDYLISKGAVSGSGSTIPDVSFTLTAMDNVAVNVYTQEEYDKLMQFYELAGWKWQDGTLPTSSESFQQGFGDSSSFYVNPNDLKIDFQDVYHYVDLGYEVITLNEFFSRQGINQETQDAVYQWFEQNKPNRASKG
ncbi:MAG: ankyrin repeat domain-containing protein [Nanoarchaeota archaeon]|nr:ankyrin repeat domain-containing protein [Nanoarchaeota archaeon]